MKEYDRRTLLDKRTLGQRYTHSLLEDAMGTHSGCSPPSPQQDIEEVKESLPVMSYKPTSSRRPIHYSSEEDEDGPEKGDIIAVVLPGSTAQHPLVTLGKVFKVDSLRKEVRMTRFCRTEGPMYKNNVFGESGRYPFTQIVYPIDIEYHQKDNLYELRTPLSLIHEERQRKTL